MARRDGTGPTGQGSLTGRGLGICNGNLKTIERQGRCVGLGQRRGRGFGLGLAQRRGFGQNIEFDLDSTKTEKEFLTEQKELLEDRLNLIKEELENL